MSIIQGTAKQGATRGFYPLNIEQSLRFNDNDSAYLSRTPASAGNRKTWTWSGWVKRGNLGSGSYMSLFGALDGVLNSYIVFNTTSQTLEVGQGATVFRRTSAVYRDVSSWYHIVVASDTTQVTPADRIKIWVNGNEVTSFATSTDLTLNSEWYINNTTAHALGAIYPSGSAGLYLDGYLAEVHFTDGTAYDADAFGEFKSGVWVAKSPSVTYGTNGFYLDFANSADIGNDVSGEGNDWTPNFFTASDVVLDSPTDNYAVLNPINKGSSLTVSNGNLDFSAAGTASNVFATMPFTGGKFYFEVTFSTVIAASWGIATKDASITANIGAGGFTNFWGFYCNPTANYVRSGTNPWNNGTITTSSVGQIAVDATDPANVKMWIGVDNTWYNSSGGTTGDPATGANATETLTNNVDFFPFFGAGNASPSWSANFGQLGFTYTPPTGYLALSTANLPEPTISPADDASPSDYFNTILYAGNSSTNARTGVGFQPDFVWMKGRTNSSNPTIVDAVRGITKSLATANANGDITHNSGKDFLSFDSDGFTLGTPQQLAVNNSGQNYVAWNWKANGSGVSNTDGTITSTVSANTTSGFSIVTYSANNTAGATIGHGLDSAPEMIIVKKRNAAERWCVYHTATSNAYIYLNETFAAETANAALRFGNDSVVVQPSSTVFTIGTSNDVNGSSGTYVAYAFHSVEGFSKFGSYTGNGSDFDGAFVYTGHRPAWVMIKRTNGSDSWVILDVARNTFNKTNSPLFPDGAFAEETNDNRSIDILSNGFKIRSNSNDIINVSGGTYIFASFAENPFKYSNAR